MSRKPAPEGDLPGSSDTSGELARTEFWWRALSNKSRSRSVSWLTTTLLASISICTAFSLVFRFQIAPVFAYGGIRYRDPNLAFLFLSFALAWALILTLGPGPLRGSRILTAALVYLVGIPALIIPNLIDIQSRETSFGLVVFYFLCLASVAGGSRAIPQFELPRVHIPEWAVVAFLTLFTIATLWLLQRYVGVNWRAVNFRDIYGARDGYSERISRAPALLGYLIAIQMKAVGPILLLMGMASRRWRPLTVVASVSQYLLFATTFAKQSLLSLIHI